MKRNFIPYGKQYIDEDDINEVIKVLKSDYLTTGPEIEKFEADFAKYVGSKYAVAISNGTAALHAACFATGINIGDEVITTPMTFAASANAILYCGGIPVFADINPLTYNIDPEKIREKITNRTKAIIPVHFTGQPCDMDEINNIAKEFNLTVIEDASHALGAIYKDRKIGAISDMSTFSFHPVKHITTGEGGMITTDRKDLYEKLILFRSHGITRNNDLLEKKNEESWYYEQCELGYNFRITDIQCALGRSQLRKIDMFVNRRIEIANIYNEAFDKIDWITIPYQDNNRLSSWHIYILKFDLNKLNMKRNDIFNILKTKGIGVNLHYIPVYLHPYYKKLGYERGLCPEAESLYEYIITIPLFPMMTDEDVERVIESVINL